MFRKLLTIPVASVFVVSIFVSLGLPGQADAAFMERFVAGHSFAGKAILWDPAVGDYVSIENIQWIFDADGTFSTNFHDERLEIVDVSGTYQVVGRVILLHLGDACPLCPRPVVLTNITVNRLRGYLSFVYDRTWTMSGGEQAFVAFELSRKHRWEE